MADSEKKDDLVTTDDSTGKPAAGGIFTYSEEGADASVPPPATPVTVGGDMPSSGRGTGVAGAADASDKDDAADSADKDEEKDDATATDPDKALDDAMKDVLAGIDVKFDELRNALGVLSTNTSKLRSNLTKAQEKGIKSKIRKQRIATMKAQIGPTQEAVDNVETIVSEIQEQLDREDYKKWAASTPARETKASSMAIELKDSEKTIASAHGAIDDAKAYGRKAFAKNVFAVLALVVGGAAALGALHHGGQEVVSLIRTNAAGNGNTVSPPGPDTEIEHNVSEQSIKSIQNVIDKIIGNPSIEVTGVDSLQMDVDGNYHMLVEAAQNGEKILISVALPEGEVPGEDITTAGDFSGAAETLEKCAEEGSLVREDMGIYYTAGQIVAADQAEQWEKDIKDALGLSEDSQIYLQGICSEDAAGKKTGTVNVVAIEADGDAVEFDSAVEVSGEFDRDDFWAIAANAIVGDPIMGVDFSGKVVRNPDVNALGAVDPVTGLLVNGEIAPSAPEQGEIEQDGGNLDNTAEPQLGR